MGVPFWNTIEVDGCRNPGLVVWEAWWKSGGEGVRGAQKCRGGVGSWSTFRESRFPAFPHVNLFDAHFDWGPAMDVI